jgi:WD domain, G-beta repeat
MHCSASHIVICACNHTPQQKFAQQSPRLQPMPTSYGYTVKAKGGGLVQQYTNIHLQHGLHLHQHTAATNTASTITAAEPRQQQQQQQQQPTLAISNAPHSNAGTSAAASLLLLAHDTVDRTSIAPVPHHTVLSDQLALVSTDTAATITVAKQQHYTNNSHSTTTAAIAQQRRGAMGQIPLSEPLHSTDITALITNEAHRTAAAAHDGLLQRLRTQHGSLCCHHGTVNAVAWSHDETRLATAGSDGCVKLWDPNVLYTTTTSSSNSTHSKVYDTGVCNGVHKGGALSVSWSPDSLFLASCGADSSVIIWSATTLCAVRILRGHCDVVHSVTFAQGTIGRAAAVPDTISSPSAALLLLSCGGEGDVKLWDLAPVSHHLLHLTLHTHMSQLYIVQCHVVLATLRSLRAARR